ncbi:MULTISPECIES: recombination mediator RecR [unclassified Corynebacterium]|uniref:recombination mediator RecR n=1 Tax=unclassified Corynebacterium TaxID=2624378 RepID=UPI001EF60AE2|nr:MULTISPECIES: recombination mediator RecR [unclassified Corynebacterium]MCG7258264.1 recombination mediator RecR [Corynebacterium sp. ACRQK]MCG7262809.1 recombination mediator RecR [Corynebacterium sp. ACRQL]
MFEGPLQDVIDEFSRLPGIGPKSAQRIALHLLNEEPEDIERFQNALGRLQRGVTFCRICHNISQEDVCRICADSNRDKSIICVVEESKDIQVIERTAEYRGRYHVLGGALDPLNGIGPKELNVTPLVQRIGGALPDVALGAKGGGASLGDADTPAGGDPGSAGTGDVESADVEYDEAPEITEVIIATDPNTEGEATASYLGRLLRDFPGLTVTRLASGIPMGGDLEFVDELTLSRAFAGRTAL